MVRFHWGSTVTGAWAKLSLLVSAGRRVLDKTGHCPIYLVHFVTSACNFSCDHCFYWKSLNQKNHELDIDEIRAIAKTCRGVKLVILTGGEPFLRRDLPEIIAAWHKLAGVPRISIPTNAYTPEKIGSAVRDSLGSCPNLELTVTLSLDGLQGRHDEVRRRPGSFERVIDTYDTLADITRKFPNLGISVVATYCRANQYEIEDLYRFVRSRMPLAYFSMNLIRGDPKDVTLLNDLDLGPYRRLSRAIVQDGLSPRNVFLNALSGAKSVVKYSLIQRTAETKGYQTPCYAGALSGVLSETGDVAPCELLGLKFGNVRDHRYDLRKIWSLDVARQAREWIIGTHCFCTHECPMTSNVLFNPRFYPELMSVALALGREKRSSVSVESRSPSTGAPSALP
jgi:MoaA/NifB/PqqE/SkfB family radical SAM enzyme